MLKSFVVFLIASTVVAVKSDTRIIGGREVDIAAHPFLVSVRYRANVSDPYLHKCAGSIYSPKFILTGAQCVVDIGDHERLMVVAGGNIRNGFDGYVYPVEKWFSHPDYNYMTVDSDIGILMLQIPIDMIQNLVSTIAIKMNRPAVGKLGTIAGWGYREEFGPSSYRLEEARVPIVNQKDCEDIYGVGEVTDNMICAGYVNVGGIDACHGDTGGPLVVENELVGLVSWGRGCARPFYPGVYTLVYKFQQWIDDITNNEKN